MPPDNVFLPQERVCCKQKKWERKEFNRSDFLRLTIQRVWRLIANDGTTFAFVALILKKLRNLPKKWTEKAKNVRENFVINGFLKNMIVFKIGQKLSKNYWFYRKNKLFYLFTRNLRENFGALSMLIVVKRD